MVSSISLRVQFALSEHDTAESSKSRPIFAWRMFAPFLGESRNASVNKFLNHVGRVRATSSLMQSDQERIASKGISNAVRLKIAEKRAPYFCTPLNRFTPFSSREGLADDTKFFDMLRRSSRREAITRGHTGQSSRHLC